MAPGPVTIEVVRNLIHLIRGQKVMLDSDLAELYGVETKALNRAVKRHVARFPDDFLLHLTREEVAILRYQIGTSSSGSGGLLEALHQPAFVLLRQLVLPNPQDAPSFLSQRAVHEAIARLVAHNLLAPERRILFRLHRMPRTVYRAKASCEGGPCQKQLAAP